MTGLRKAAEQALEAMAGAERVLRYENLYPFVVADVVEASDALRAALRRDAINEVHQMDHENRDADELDMIGGWS